MAPESQMKNALSGVTTKQKAIAGALAIIVIVVIWQAVGLMGGGSSDSSSKMPEKISPQSSAAAKSGGGQQQARSSTMSQQAYEEQPQVRPVASLPNENQFLKLQRESEQQYVSKLNELESLKIQRQIAEINQGIAAAKLATVTAEKGISDLLTKPMAPQLSAGDYANRLSSPVRQGEAVVPQQPGQAVSPEVPYTVISVSMQLHKWNAVIGFQGKLYSVSTGDTLPLDGSVVESISRSGVVLNKEGKKRKVSLVSAI